MLYLWTEWNSTNIKKNFKGRRIGIRKNLGQKNTELSSVSGWKFPNQVKCKSHPGLHSKQKAVQHVNGFEAHAYRQVQWVAPRKNRTKEYY